MYRRRRGEDFGPVEMLRAIDLEAGLGSREGIRAFDVRGCVSKSGMRSVVYSLLLFRPASLKHHKYPASCP